MPVISGSSCREIALSLAKEMGMHFIPAETRRFPDGEGYLKTPAQDFESIRSEPAVIVSSTFPDNGIIQTMMMLASIADIQRGDLSNLKKEGVQEMEDVGRKIILAVPYLSLIHI